MTYIIDMQNHMQTIYLNEFGCSNLSNPIPRFDRPQFLNKLEGIPYSTVSDRFSETDLQEAWKYYGERFGFASVSYKLLKSATKNYVEVENIVFDNEESYLLFVLKFNVNV